MLGLILLFGFAVSASLLWLGGVLFYVYAKIGFPNLFALPMTDLTMLSATAFLPVIFLWMAVSLIYNVITLKKQGTTITLLLTQARRSADHAEAMVRTLMETQLQSRSAMVLHNADLFINELNDLLADIVVRFGLIQPAHTELVWQRVGDGNRWAFCKVVLNNADNSPKFQEDLKEQLRRDKTLAHLVRTFCYRFEQMFTMLERHDIEHYLTKIFEEGALGRVYLRFVEACRAVEQAEQAEADAVSYAAVPQPVPETPDVPEYEPAAYEDSGLQDSEPSEKEERMPERTFEKQPVRERPSDTAAPFGFLRPTR